MVSAVRFKERMKPKVAVVRIDLYVVAIQVAVESEGVFGHATGNDGVIGLVERNAGNTCRNGSTEDCSQRQRAALNEHQDSYAVARWKLP